jgi:hypothetical protein
MLLHAVFLERHGRGAQPLGFPPAKRHCWPCLPRLQLLRAKGLGELSAAPAGATAELGPQQQAARQESMEEQAAAAGLPWDRVWHGLAAIFSALHTPHGSAAEALVREARAAVADHRVLGAERTLHTLCDQAGVTMAQLAEHDGMLGA